MYGECSVCPFYRRKNITSGPVLSFLYGIELTLILEIKSGVTLLPVVRRAKTLYVYSPLHHTVLLWSFYLIQCGVASNGCKLSNVIIVGHNLQKIIPILYKLNTDYSAQYVSLPRYSLSPID